MKTYKWLGYPMGIGLVALASLLYQLGHEFVSPVNMIMVYLLTVVVSAIFWGFGPSILVSVLSVLAFDFFFVPPFLTFTVDDTQYIFTFVVLLLVGIIISYLTSRIRLQTEAARERERQTAALYALGKDLAVANDLTSYIRAIIQRIRETFELDTMIFLPDAQNKGALKPFPSNAVVNEKEFAAAMWSFQHQRVVGHGTDILSDAMARYIPLVTARGTVGVIAVQTKDFQSKLNIEQEHLLEAYADLVAVAIEGILLAEESQNTQVLRATEKLQTALLNAISHDLRTPLVSVIGVLSSLQDEGMVLDDNTKRNLIQVAREEAERLNHLITNLLDESRIEAGALKISKQPSEVQDLIGTALEQIGGHAASRPINIDIPVDLPFLSVDFGLIVQALVNILNNSIKYSPDGSSIDIKARQTAREVQIEIADHGVGILQQDLERVFDKFYRIQRPDNVVGTGLGLSICKGIVEAHGGHILAENRLGGGTVIRLILPVNELNLNSGEIR